MITKEAKASEFPGFWTQRVSFADFLASLLTKGNAVYPASKFQLLPPHKIRETLASTPLRTDAGHAVFAAMDNAHVYDLACGDSAMPKLVAELSGAKAYTGVDIKLPDTTALPLSGIPQRYIESDVRAYVETLSPNKGEKKVFCIFGFEPHDPNDPATCEYVQSVMENISRVTQEGDYLMVGMGTGGAFRMGGLGDPIRFGFDVTGLFKGPIPGRRNEECTHLVIFRKKG